MLVEELTAMARRFHALARITSDPVTKKRVMALADDYLGQADDLKRKKTLARSVYPISKKRHNRTHG